MKFLLLALFMMAASVAIAFSNETPLANHEDEQRAQDLFKSIRCQVCQGESLAESNAEIAGDMRKLIRGKIKVGDSDQQIQSYFSAHYGDQILQDPPFNNKTYFLWLTPLVIFLFGGLFILKSTRLKNIFK